MYIRNSKFKKLKRAGKDALISFIESKVKKEYINFIEDFYALAQAREWTWGNISITYELILKQLLELIYEALCHNYSSITTGRIRVDQYKENGYIQINVSITYH